MNNGWIKLYRNILDHPFWMSSTPEQKTIFITLLLMVNTEDKSWIWKGEKIICKAGQVITSLDEIAKIAGNGVSVRNVRTTLSNLELHDMATNESTKRGRLITICKWHTYKNFPEANDKVTDKQVTKKLTKKLTKQNQPPMTKQVTNQLTNKNQQSTIEISSSYNDEIFSSDKQTDKETDKETFSMPTKQTTKQLTNEKEKETKKEKETFPPYTPYKEKEINKEKEKGITSPSLRSEEVCEKTSFSPAGLCARRREEVDFKKIESLYHEICPSYPRLQRWSDARKQKVSIRFVDEMKQDWELLENIFRKMQASKFLRGDNKNGWKANFDWVFTNSTNWVKIIEGNFDNRTPTTQTPQPYATTTPTYRQSTDDFHRQRDEQVYGGLFRTLVGDASER